MSHALCIYNLIHLHIGHSIKNELFFLCSSNIARLKDKSAGDFFKKGYLNIYKYSK